MGNELAKKLGDAVAFEGAKEENHGGKSDNDSEEGDVACGEAYAKSSVDG